MAASGAVASSECHTASQISRPLRQFVQGLPLLRYRDVRPVRRRTRMGEERSGAPSECGV